MKLFYLSRLIFLWSNESLNEKIILFSREIEEKRKKGTKREQFETRTTIFPQLRSVPAFRVSIPFHSSLVLKSRGEQSCYQRTTPLFPSPRYSSSNNAASFQSPDLVHTFAYSWARVPRLATTRRGKIFWTPSEKKIIILAFTLRIGNFFHRIIFIILPSFISLFSFFFKHHRCFLNAFFNETALETFYKFDGRRRKKVTVNRSD